MAEYLVTRKRHVFETVVVHAPSAAEAKRKATTAAEQGEVAVRYGTPENWHAQKRNADGR